MSGLIVGQRVFVRSVTNIIRSGTVVSLDADGGGALGNVQGCPSHVQLFFKPEQLIAAGAMPLPQPAEGHSILRIIVRAGAENVLARMGQRGAWQLLSEEYNEVWGCLTLEIDGDDTSVAMEQALNTDTDVRCYWVEERGGVTA
jgi:hypothetical protein